MSEYIDKLVKFYNDEKNKEKPKSYVKSIKELLKFYGVNID
jgi:hypothetical protein